MNPDPCHPNPRNRNPVASVSGWEVAQSEIKAAAELVISEHSLDDRLIVFDVHRHLRSVGAIAARLYMNLDSFTCQLLAAGAINEYFLSFMRQHNPWPADAPH